MLPCAYWLGGEVETRRIANPPCTDAISVRASNNEEIEDQI
jgi:hypothetical protein